jgi:hypothetical protein
VSVFGEDTLTFTISIFKHVRVTESVLNLVVQTLIGLIHACAITGVLIELRGSGSMYTSYNG